LALRIGDLSPLWDSRKPEAVTLFAHKVALQDSFWGVPNEFFGRKSIAKKNIDGFIRQLAHTPPLERIRISRIA
jgi:hypothetical protein